MAEDYKTMTITLEDEEFEQVLFPTWSDENGQDDLIWYEATRNEAGNWTATVDLLQHHS